MTFGAIFMLTFILIKLYTALEYSWCFFLFSSITRFDSHFSLRFTSSRLIHHIQLEQEHRAALILRQYTVCFAQGALIVIDVLIFANDETS